MSQKKATRSQDEGRSEDRPKSLASAFKQQDVDVRAGTGFVEEEDLDARAAAGETVVPGGTGGKSVEAQKRLAEGRSKGGQSRSKQLGSEGYSEMGKLGGLSSSGADGAEIAEERGVDVDTSKFTNE